MRITLPPFICYMFNSFQIILLEQMICTVFQPYCQSYMLRSSCRQLTSTISRVQDRLYCSRDAASVEVPVRYVEHCNAKRMSVLQWIGKSCIRLTRGLGGLTGKWLLQRLEQRHDDDKLTDVISCLLKGWSPVQFFFNAHTLYGSVGRMNIA